MATGNRQLATGDWQLFNQVEDANAG